MPEDIKPNPTLTDVSAHNAEIAARQKAQDISGQSSVTGEFGDAIDALDKLAAQVQPKPEDATPKPGDAPAPKPDAPKSDAPKPDAPSVPDPELVKKTDEIFKDSPSLAPNASPKSSEAFHAVKIKAAQEISAREQQIEELKKQIDAAKKPSTDQLTREKELEELKQWRAKLDVDYDPKFKSHDQAIDQTREFIYAQLAQNPMVTPEAIAQIKKIGGPDKINLTKFFEAVQDPTLQRLVEAKVADIQMAKYHKDQAIKAAKDNITAYTKERQEATAKEAVASTQAVTTHLSQTLDKLEWFTVRDTAGVTDSTQKKEIEEHNEFVSTLKSQVAEAVKDDSPQMRAILITGMAQLFQLQRNHQSATQKLAATEKALADVTAKWEKVKGASKSRLGESSAPAGGIAAPAPKDNGINVAPGDALDALARQVMEKKSQAAAGQ